ncbi:RNA polymerase sigma factor [Chloroflexota bacterium]
MAKQTKIDDFEAVFDQYKGWVYKTAYLITQNHYKAEDVMQEVFINAYRSNGTYNPKKGNLSSWLRRITINQCLKDKRDKSPSTYSIEEMEEQGHSIPDENLPLSEQVTLKNDIRRLLSSLNQKSRAVLILRYYDGLAYSEIAELLNIPLGTVKSRINTAISTLQTKQGQAGKD